MKMNLTKAIGIILASAIFVCLGILGYALYDFRPKEYIVEKGGIEVLTEEAALRLSGSVLIKELKLESNQLKPIPYQENNSYFAQNSSSKNEGSIIWYISSSAFDPTHTWHIHTKIILREHDILVKVSRPK